MSTRSAFQWIGFGGTDLSGRDLINVLLLLVLLCTPVLIFLDGFIAMAEMWQLSSYNHGYLVPFVSLFILVSERHRLRGLDWQGSLLGLGCLAVTLVAWMVGRATSIQAVEFIALMTIVVSFAWAVVGDKLWAAAWFPMLYLYLAVPVGEAAVPFLQNATADVATAALNLTGVAAYRDGLFITLPGGDFEVAKACSGFRYLNAGVAMATLIAYLFLQSAWVRVVYIALVGALFVFANGIRAFLVMIIASASEMRYMVGEDHVLFGYGLFISVAALAYWFASRLARFQQSNGLAG